jgi:flagellar hook-associated protein 1
VRTLNSQIPLALTGGTLAGTIDARDGALLDLRTSVDILASTLITEVNILHTAGYSLTGSTGAFFFQGTGADDIRVNPTLVNNPSLIQASGVAGATGDNAIALQLAQLGQRGGAIWGGRTFTDEYARIVSDLGSEVKNSNGQISDHNVVNLMLLKQRESVSGVSIDEEMTNLITFQKAYQASARIVTTADEMLDTILNMKR